MTLREAFLKTANLFERRPQAYNYFGDFVPASEEGCGCPLAWVGFYMGEPARTHTDVITAKYFAEENFVRFSRRVDCLTEHVENGCNSDCWHRNPEKAVPALRKYVDIYYPGDCM